MSRTVGDCLRGRDNNFDFIRFMAALLVIFSHSFFLTPSAGEPLMQRTHGFYQIGTVCVAIFFIISGFLITRSFDRSRNISDYINSRVLRIYPALIVVVFCIVFIIGPLFTTQSLYDYFTDFRTFKYYYSNTLSVNVQYWLPGVFESNHGSHMVNASLWTLGYELFCYCLVAAIGCFFINKKKTGIILLVITILIFRNQILHGREANLRTVLYFAFGALIYIYRNRIVLNNVVALIALCLLVINMYYNPVYAFSLIITGILLSYITIFLCFAKTKYFKHFAKYGDFSYGLYIWGYLVQQVLNSFAVQLNVFVFFLVSAAITLILAALSWHVIEKRALKLKENLKYQTVIARRSAQVKGMLLNIMPSLLLKKLPLIIFILMLSGTCPYFIS